MRTMSATSCAHRQPSKTLDRLSNVDQSRPRLLQPTVHQRCRSMNLRNETREALGPARHRHLGHRCCRSCLNEDAQDLERLGFQVGEGGFRDVRTLRRSGESRLAIWAPSRDLSKPMDKRAVQYQQVECAARATLAYVFLLGKDADCGSMRGRSGRSDHGDAAHQREHQLSAVSQVGGGRMAP